MCPVEKETAVLAVCLLFLRIFKLCRDCPNRRGNSRRAVNDEDSKRSEL